MLTPRSYLFSRNTTASSSKAPERRNARSKGARREEAGAKPAARRDMSHTLTASSAIPGSITSDPVVIPARSRRDSSRNGPRHAEKSELYDRGRQQQPHQVEAHRRARDIHSPDAIPPSVAALLALTSIPPQKKPTTSRRNGRPHQHLTVDSILQQTGGTEKEISLSLGTSHLDFLLSPPEEQAVDQDDGVVGSDAGRSYLSSGTMSSESVPSLGNSSIDNSSLSLASLATSSLRGKRPLPKRGRLQSLSSSVGESPQAHPLSGREVDIEALDFRVFSTAAPRLDHGVALELPVVPRPKSAFKSNLTASLKAIRSAARTFSNMTTPMLTPDDFLTRSIISIDPQVPFTDERMPPRLEDTPTPALRRYLNPTTNAPIEAHVPSSLAQTSSTLKCTASIQMQTYRVSKASKVDSPNIISRRTRTNTPEEVFAEVSVGPVARQRDMRENSDFIRVAVMEMMMRRHGKLDERVPGRAKWALPPRSISTKVYEIGEDGVPVRWIASTG
ncbi:MAG: hypothetical protein M1818_006869 [Claussenomyces sp. TS43310]|nr:MAG: hypothetical protein M1818_006869 [Claussenomyces sp. TS43310]